jgi:hypothetical protein
MNLDHLKRLGLSATIGLFIGILAVVYIGPETTSGAALLIGLCVLVTTIVGQLVAMLGHLVRPAAKRRHRTPSHARLSPASKALHTSDAQPPRSAEKARGERHRNAPSKAHLGHPRRT